MNPAQPASNCSNRAGRFAVMLTLLLCATLRAQTGSTSLITAITSPRQVVNLGQNLTLSVTAPTATSFQWKRNGLPIAGATSATYTITGATRSRDNGWYQVVASNVATSTTSPVIFVIVRVPAVAFAWGSSTYYENEVPTDAGELVGLAAGGTFNFLIRPDGTLIGFGNNGYNQATPPSDLSSVVDVAIGQGTYGHAIALKADGTISTWGYYDGLVGLPSTATGLVAVAAGSVHSVALRSNGTVLGWGLNPDGQAAIPAALDGIVAVAAGWAHTLMLKADGSVVGVGGNGSGELSIPRDLVGVKAIAAGGRTSLALKSDGTVVGWGSNSSGQTTIPSAALANVVAIAVGNAHCLALKVDGTLVAWGANNAKQSSVPDGLSRIVAISASGDHNLVLHDARGDSRPAIVTPPANLQVSLGQVATFGVVANGAGTLLSYQWRKAGDVILGATSSTYSIGEVVASNAGRYDVIVSNYLGSVTSNAATLTVTAPAPAAPAITTQPASQSVNVGSSVIFSAVASGSTPLNYQWRKDGTALNAATAATLTLNNVQIADAGSYTVVVSNSASSVTSSAAALTISSVPGPAVTTQETWTVQSSPTTQNLWGVCYAGGQFVAVGEGGTIITSPDGSTWTKRVSGNSLWLVSVGYGNGLFVVVGDLGTILTSPDGVTWTTRRTGGTRINAVTFGNGIFLAVDERGGSWKSSDGINWSFNPTYYSGNQLRGLVFVPPTFVVTGSGGCIQVTNDGESWTPRTINTTAFVESIAYGRGTYVVLGASNLTFTSRDSVTWTPQKNSPAYFHGVGYFNELFVGATDNGSIVTSPDGKDWTVRTTGSTQLLIAVANNDTTGIVVGFGGTILRSIAVKRPPTILDHPDSIVEAAGNNVLLRAIADGSSPLVYQWFFNSVPLRGATDDTLLLSNVQAAQAGRYTLSVSNSVGVVSSNAAVLAVLPSFPATTPIIDSSFTSNPSPTSAPEAAIEQPDGKIIIGGKFIYLFNGVPQFGIARLNPDGSLDPTFKAGSGVGGTDASVGTLAIQADGKVLIGGVFTSVAGIPRINLARLNPTGEVDTTFVPPTSVSGFVSQIVVQADGKVLVLSGGSLRRLNPDGSVDQSFANSPLATSFVTMFAISAATGRIIAGVASSAGVGVPVILKAFKSDGAADSGFSQLVGTALFSNVFSQIIILKAVQGEKVLVGKGSGFGDIQGAFEIRRLNSDGSPDLSFSPISEQLFRSSVAAQTDSLERIICNTFGSGVGSTTVRYNTDGTKDPTFRFNTTFTPANTPIRAVALAQGRLLLLGEFSAVDGVQRSRIARTVASNGAPSNLPQIAPATPTGTQVQAGATVTFKIITAGTGPFTYSYRGGPSNNAPPLTQPRNTVAIVDGAMTITNVQGSGVYTINVTNAAGTATAYYNLEVRPAAPLVLGVPQNLSVNSGRSAVFTVDAIGSDPRSYQWFFNDTPVGTNNPTLTVPNVAATSAGTYTVVVRNNLGTVTSSVRLSVDDTSRLTNIATRGLTGAGENVLIVGFVITGPTAKTVLIRGIGPSLALFGLSGSVVDPILSLYDSAGTKILENDNWGTAGGLVTSSLFSQLGAFPLPAGSLDSAIVRSLQPGRYTAQLSDTAGRSGVGLVEIYENDLLPSRLVNLSSRVLVGAGSSLAIPGIVVRGPVPKKLLIRAVGPTLSSFGVQTPLADPVLTIVGANNETVASNDNWGAATNAAEIGTTSATVGAFALPAGSKDAALVLTLPPGNYTALVTGSGDTSGIALIEVYEVP